MSGNPTEVTAADPRARACLNMAGCVTLGCWRSHVNNEFGSADVEPTRSSNCTRLVRAVWRSDLYAHEVPTRDTTVVLRSSAAFALGSTARQVMLAVVLCMHRELSKMGVHQPSTLLTALWTVPIHAYMLQTLIQFIVISKMHMHMQIVMFVVRDLCVPSYLYDG